MGRRTDSGVQPLIQFISYISTFASSRRSTYHIETGKWMVYQGRLINPKPKMHKRLFCPLDHLLHSGGSNLHPHVTAVASVHHNHLHPECIVPHSHPDITVSTSLNRLLSHDNDLASLIFLYPRTENNLHILLYSFT